MNNIRPFDGWELPPSEIIVSAKKPRARGYIEDWKPQKATQKLLGTVGDIIAKAEIDTVLPMTIRQVFYRLVGVYDYGKTERAYKGLAETLNKARRAGWIDWDAIRDDGLARSNAPGWNSETSMRADVLRWVGEGINLQVNQPIRQWVICEAGGMVPQLATVADEFGVTVLSAGGFNSVTEKRALGIEMANVGQPSLVWHIGDYDPSGVHVFQSLAEDVSAFAEAKGGEVSFQRLAVTPDQIEEYRLPMSPTKSTDARAFDGTGTVQAEAIDPVEIQRLLRNGLAGYFDEAMADAVRSQSADWSDKLNEVWK